MFFREGGALPAQRMGGPSVPGGWGRVKSLMALTVVIDGQNQYDPRELEIQEIELLQNRPVTAQGGQIVPGGLWHCCGPDTGLRREEGGEFQRHPFPFRFPAWLKSSGIPLRSTASSTRYRSRDLPNSSVWGMGPLEKGGGWSPLLHPLVARNVFLEKPRGQRRSTKR